MHGQSPATAISRLALCPSRPFGCQLQNPAQAPGIDRVGLVRSAIVWIIGAIQIQDPRRSDQLEHVVKRIAARQMSEFVSEGLNRERMVDIGHRPQPSDAHVRHTLCVKLAGPPL